MKWHLGHLKKERINGMKNNIPYEKRAEIKKIRRTNELAQLKNDILTGITAIAWSILIAWLVCMYLVE